MKQDISSKNKSSNIILKIGITYIVPIFLVVIGAFIVMLYCWNYLFGKLYFGEGSLDSINKSYAAESQRASYNMNGKEIIKPYMHEKFAKIDIGTIGLYADIYEGTLEKSLEMGIGRNVRGGMPGEGRNCVLKGYRSGEFAKLKDVKIGDEVKIETEYGKYYYKVVKMDIINIDQLETMDYFGKTEKLTLCTGYPFEALGKEQQEYIVSCEFLRVEI